MKIEGLKTSSKNWLYYFIEAMEMSLNECRSCAKKAEQQNRKAYSAQGNESQGTGADDHLMFVFIFLSSLQ